MLPKNLRLGGRESFESIFRSKNAIFGSEIALFFRFGTNRPPRIGFAFKQKAFPKAVTRHFLKRKGSAIMSELQGRLPFGADVIILFQRPFSGGATYRGIKQALEALIERLNKAKK